MVILLLDEFLQKRVKMQCLLSFYNLLSRYTRICLRSQYVDQNNYIEISIMVIYRMSNDTLLTVMPQWNLYGMANFNT